MVVKGFNYIKNLIFFVLLGAIASLFLEAPEIYYPNAVDVCDSENNSFEPGEEIEYELYYNWGLIWIPAGFVKFNIVDKNEFLELTAIGSTFPSYDSFYKVRDTFYSLIDKQTMLPVTFYRDIKEGNYSLFSEIEFDQKNHRATSVVSRKGKSKSYDFEYANCMHDILSIIYYLRTLDYTQFEENHRFPVSILLDRKIYNLYLRYEGKEVKKKVKGLGRFKSREFALELIAGNIFKKGDEMKAWVTDDKNKIGLLIESPISVGSIKAVLSGYKGLKYDFNSKVK